MTRATATSCTGGNPSQYEVIADEHIVGRIALFSALQTVASLGYGRSIPPSMRAVSVRTVSRRRARPPWKRSPGAGSSPDRERFLTAHRKGRALLLSSNGSAHNDHQNPLWSEFLAIIVVLFFITKVTTPSRFLAKASFFGTSTTDNGVVEQELLVSGNLSGWRAAKSRCLSKQFGLLVEPSARRRNRHQGKDASGTHDLVRHYCNGGAAPRHPLLT